MKSNKNTKKTTLTSVITDLNRWYGNSWKISGLVMLGIFILSVILPGILG